MRAFGHRFVVACLGLIGLSIGATLFAADPATDAVSFDKQVRLRSKSVV